MLEILSYVLSLVSLVCFIMVVVKMFQHNQTALGIISIVGVCLCGIGPLIAFIYGWIKSGEWNIKPLMLVWTVAIIASIVMNFVYSPPWVAQFQAQMQQLQQGR